MTSTPALAAAAGNPTSVHPRLVGGCRDSATCTTPEGTSRASPPSATSSSGSPSASSAGTSWCTYRRTPAAGEMNERPSIPTRRVSMEFRIQNSECRIQNENAGFLLNPQLQPLHRTLNRRADLTNVPLDVAIDRWAAQDDLVDRIATQRRLELSQRTTNGHAGYPAVRLHRIVVDKRNRVHLPVRVRAHFPHQQLAERARAIHQHAAAALVPGGSH